MRKKIMATILGTAMLLTAVFYRLWKISKDLQVRRRRKPQRKQTSLTDFSVFFSSSMDLLILI